ncbi:hypothetical protein V5O48_018048 [Marasmius crinis-equi]|uniref:Uncharacterized protein n=1 Tax=Marasmius crinis-equi TaxID=585013 RepID=A0ABR3EM85_9AGAR
MSDLVEEHRSLQPFVTQGLDYTRIHISNRRPLHQIEGFSLLRHVSSRPSNRHAKHPPHCTLDLRTAPNSNPSPKLD